MPKKIAPRFKLPYGWIRGEDYWGGPMSDSQIAIDTFMSLTLESLTYSAPPPDAKDGMTYVVAANATGAWNGHVGDIARLIEGTWVFYKPIYGLRARAKSFNAFLWYDGTNWINELTGDNPVDPTPDPSIKPKWFDVCATVSDSLYSNEPFIHLPILDPLMLPANMVGSQLDMADGASPAYVQLRVQRNGTNVATITVDNGAFGATFTTVGGNPVSFAAGDRLTVRAPTERIEAFKNFGMVIRLGVM